MQQIARKKAQIHEAERSLLAMINAGSMLQAVCVAAELGIADLLSDSAKDAEALASKTRCHAPSLNRLMRALCAMGFCIQNDDGSFALTELGSTLRTDSDRSLRSWTLWAGHHMWPVWGALGYSVRSGKNARKLFTGTDGFGHLDRDENLAAVFNSAMAEMTRLVARDLIADYDFSAMYRVLDIGGGYGALVMAILDANPHLHGVIFDRPHALTHGEARLAERGLSSRCELMAGDFFQSVPANADAYLLKSILHDWDDEDAATILRNCRIAIPAHGKLLIVERTLPERFETTISHQALARADLNMLVALGGRERSEREYEALLARSGFALIRTAPIGFEFSLIEAAPT
jgi:ubiquinone/menaquinone biosynthesis C-methylase UbiE